MTTEKKRQELIKLIKCLSNLMSLKRFVREIKDEKEDSVLGSLPLLSFRIGGVEPSDNITRKFAFKILMNHISITAGDKQSSRGGSRTQPPDRNVCQS
ncbi:pleckstrin homology domain-containing family A member 6 isoform X15 [Lates japonicus]|uniref:Pleckstrin homology domain-containing family A member 6 isoform X15 n=1 Tax=Lates japonicus TaxID=270547 RepID=A0AAD3RN93_LATJO|nr:pleckstrin homology domain-containing family A member 6 isoform X15 [Lates japonicus]